MEGISNKIVVILVLIAMVISIAGTLVVTSTYERVTSNPGATSQTPTGNAGVVTLSVAPSTGGVISLNVADSQTPSDVQ